MGRVTRASAAKELAAQSPPTIKPEPLHLPTPPTSTTKPKAKTGKTASTQKKPSPQKSTITSNNSRKRSLATVKAEDNNVNDLSHGLGWVPTLTSLQENDENESPSKKPQRRRTTKSAISGKDNEQELDQTTTTDPATTAIPVTTDVPPTPKKSKKVVLGVSPFPAWPHPTPEECEEVNRLLSSVHGEVKAPEAIPVPSLEVAGCGEVPSVLDALLRTLLSGNTTMANANKSMDGLAKRFGILKEGIGKGSVDWNEVRLATTKDVHDAIKAGGLADKKSKFIKEILNMVWEETQARREDLIATGAAPGSSNETAEAKQVEIAKAEENVLSLNHVHFLSYQDAFNKFCEYPGVSVKTASCISLFCLQRPSFAVDTHVWRMCGWLGWVPPPGNPALLAPGKKGKGPKEASADMTFLHCDVKVPDHLKYPLHQLLIKHGKNCPRCRAITGESYGDWKKGCIIDHLVKRTGARKGGDAKPGRAAKNTKAKSRADNTAEADDSDSDLTKLESDFEDED